LVYWKGALVNRDALSNQDGQSLLVCYFLVRIG
jgi:hypothetical protein